MITTDVAVVGAGLAGLEVARLLSRRGLRVTLLDRKDSVAGPVHTTGIFVRKTWEDFRLPDEQLGTAIREVVLYSPARRPLKLVADHDEFRIGRMSWIYLTLLEQCVASGVRWLPGAPLRACDPIPGGVRLTVERQGRQEFIESRFVIGADGARSAVARALDLDRNESLLAGLEEIVEMQEPAPPALHCFIDPRLAPGYIAWVVSERGEAHIGVAGDRRRFVPAESLERLKASLRDTFRFGRTVERRGGLIPVGGVLGRIACTRGLLVGDAAGAVSPLTAGGLDGALRLSRFAAAVVEAFLSADDRSALDQYSGERFRARFISRRWMRRMMNAAGTPLLAELACALLRTAPMRRIAEHIFFARGSFPEAALEKEKRTPGLFRRFL